MNEYVTRVAVAVCFTSALIGLTQSRALAVISQPLSNLGVSFVVSGPKTGQSFTADNTVEHLGIISYSHHQSNTQLSNAFVTLDLFDGAGFAGTLLATQAQLVDKTLPSGTWIDFDFAGTNLIAGQVYTFRLTAEHPSNGSQISGGYRSRSANVYAGGTQFSSSGSPLPNDDLTFRVVGAETAAVPEPATATLALLGLTGLMRRRRAA